MKIDIKKDLTASQQIKSLLIKLTIRLYHKVVNKSSFEVCIC